LPDLDLEHLAGADRLQRGWYSPSGVRETASFGGADDDTVATVEGAGVSRAACIASRRLMASAYATSRSLSVIVGCSTALAMSTTVHSWWSTAARSVTSSMVSSGSPNSSTALSGIRSIRRTTS
jgi:hypothetical protein